jgi:hypothetical protein
MSRGPGRIEKAVRAALMKVDRSTAIQLAAVAYGLPEAQLARSQVRTVRQALRRLASRGIVTGETPPSAIVWKFVRRRGRLPATERKPPKVRITWPAGAIDKTDEAVRAGETLTIIGAPRRRGSKS